MHKLTQEDVGRRVKGIQFDAEGEIVKVHGPTVADIRWDSGARGDWQQVDKEFNFTKKGEGE